jgi:hypothetical protein
MDVRFAAKSISDRCPIWLGAVLKKLCPGKSRFWNDAILSRCFNGVALLRCCEKAGFCGGGGKMGVAAQAEHV